MKKIISSIFSSSFILWAQWGRLHSSSKSASSWINSRSFSSHEKIMFSPPLRLSFLAWWPQPTNRELFSQLNFDLPKNELNSVWVFRKEERGKNFLISRDSCGCSLNRVVVVRVRREKALKKVQIENGFESFPCFIIIVMLNFSIFCTSFFSPGQLNQHEHGANHTKLESFPIVLWGISSIFNWINFPLLMDSLSFRLYVQVS